MGSLLKSHRRTDVAFQAAGAVAIDKMSSVFYAGSMRGLFGQFGAKVEPAGCIRSSHNVRTEGYYTKRSSYTCSYVPLR